MKNDSLPRFLFEWLIGKLGYELVPLWRLERRELSLHLRRVFDLFKVETVLDVGANRGQYRDFLRLEVGFEGVIHSFEPVADLYRTLLQRARGDPKWNVYRCALGSQNGEAAINVMQDSQFSSLLTPITTHLNDYDIQNRVVLQEAVVLRRLDTLMSETPALADAKNLYLKIDTQGFDLEVLEGARDVLPRVVALQSEVSVLQLYRGMPDFKLAIDTFRTKGFDLSGLFPIARDRALRVVEFDCVMVNRHQCLAERLLEPDELTPNKSLGSHHSE